MNLKTLSEPIDVARFYAKHLSAKGIRVKRKDRKMGDGLVSMLEGKRKRLRVRVSASRDNDEGATSVLITWKKS